MPAEPRTVAAWYPDLHQPEQERWWDGSSWTAHVRPVVTSAAPDDEGRAVPAAEALPIRAIASSPPQGSTAHARVMVAGTAGIALTVLGLWLGSAVVYLTAFAALVVGFLAMAWRLRDAPMGRWDAWHEQRGLRLVDPSHASTTVVRGMRAAGLERRIRILRIAEGSLWTGGPQVQLATGDVRADADGLREFTAVAFELPGTSPHRDLVLRVELRPRSGWRSWPGPPFAAGWRRFQVEPGRGGSGDVRVHLGRGQDAEAARLLLDPTLQQYLHEQALLLRHGRMGFVIGARRVVVWHPLDLVYQAGRHSQGGWLSSASMVDRLDSFVAFSREVHRRVA